MKIDFFLTEKEERTKEAKEWCLLGLFSVLTGWVIVTISRGLEIWLQGGWIIILIVTFECLAVFLVYPLYLWICGKRV